MKYLFPIFLFVWMSCTTPIHSNTTSNDIPVSNIDELNAALAKAQAGDVIVWKNGNYQDVKINFKPTNNGTAQKPIVLKAQTAGKVVFSGSSNIAIGGEYLQVEGFLFQGDCTLKGEHIIDFRSEKPSVDATHCRVTNCAIIDYTLTEASGLTNYYVNLVGTYNEVDHCYFKGKTNKGPTLVVEYKQEKGYVAGSDVAPSSHHHIHHNYFGYRTYSDNGGEQMRIGTSTTSFSHGFNVIEYNYMEEERLEAEVISNKSWDNIYRFNTFIGNDGGMVIRHGQKCFVYGNYINGKSGRKESAGLRVINPNNTVFNNYVEDLEGGDKSMKAPITIMSGLIGSALNEYYPADNAIVAYNTVVNSVGPAIELGTGNASKGKPFIAPKNVLIIGNTLINTLGKNLDPLSIKEASATYTLKDNVFSNGKTTENGFSMIKTKDISTKDGFSFVNHPVDKTVIEMINQRLAIHKIQLSENDIMQFNPKWKMAKKDVGVNWIK
jgi:poly(beta-D-mannuronate) lyase